MMFVLGGRWAQDPLMQFLGFKAQVLTKFDVKTPRFLGAEREVVIES